MICPHCHRSIREEQRYLMARDPDADWPRWAGPALWVLLFFFTVATLSVFSHVFGS